MNRLIVDTNVFLDVILSRKPLCDASAALLSLSTRPDHELLMPAHAAATIAYIVEANANRGRARQALSLCLGIAHVAPLDETTILRGLSYNFKDTEDSFVAAIAEREHATFIVTNNVKDFALSPIPAITPIEYLSRINGE
ncbi:type II toxin-antitoxin system VapC family toxin [Bifidobacterium avesanii]|uniref:PIN domain-containing protein n=1 Tax=Bifidobacterium avesanii TaxID=1798157 RepID=A0A7K3THC9_9BIFI|nr:PIN domain-containing protein [Bifidobacterium avesanii]KAB8294584.1 toxin-antitoxin system, toxin component, PIN family protein [Bifidobacterium avesanii]NEG78094.1 PIN domain-containing protein [Bifidobacterium avesanii]